ncbi:nuclear transport factor 2 family protein [Gordonia shandongensis]|uniref:nuclear transport factor 2 family protein n=1 Tax=Gordonia shandongensis TaxID=376351 RepID=UPI0003F96A20|nr:nuclear transport factor 2 family protein [Gordonia shandongensis]
MTGEPADGFAVLEAIEAVKALKHRYWRACDGKDPAGFRSCFVTRGAVVDYGRLGAFDDVEPMAAIFERVALARVDGRYAVLDMHHGANPEITVLGPGRARGRWSLQFRQINTVARTDTVTVGEYDDEYVVEDGQWRMAVCRFVERWSVSRPLGTDEQIVEGTF